MPADTIVLRTKKGTTLRYGQRTALVRRPLVQLLLPGCHVFGVWVMAAGINRLDFAQFMAHYFGVALCTLSCLATAATALVAFQPQLVVAAITT